MTNDEYLALTDEERAELRRQHELHAKLIAWAFTIGIIALTLLAYLTQ
jgi:hypothetical protein